MSLIDDITQALAQAQAQDKSKGQMWGGIASNLGNMFGGMVDDWQQGKKDTAAEEALLSLLSKTGSQNLVGMENPQADRMFGPKEPGERGYAEGSSLLGPIGGIAGMSASQPEKGSSALSSQIERRAAGQSGVDPLEVIKISLMKGVSPEKRAELAKIADMFQGAQQAGQEMDFKRQESAASREAKKEIVGMQQGEATRRTRITQKGMTKREELDNTARFLEKQLEQGRLTDRNRASIQGRLDAVNAQIKALEPGRKARARRDEAEADAKIAETAHGKPEAAGKLGTAAGKAATDPDTAITDNAIAQQLANTRTDAEAEAFMLAVKTQLLNAGKEDEVPGRMARIFEIARRIQAKRAGVKGRPTTSVPTH